MDLAYDGAAFTGFAPQPGRPTVVGALGEAIARNLRLDAPPFIVGAGRTDAGVHALAQVISFDLARSSLAEADVERFVRSLNHQLIGRVAIARLRQIDDFHARYDATWRHYRYLVTSGAPLGFTDAIAWAVGEPLDVLAMAEATALLKGVHPGVGATGPDDEGCGLETKALRDRLTEVADDRRAAGLGGKTREGGAVVGEVHPPPGGGVV